MISLKLALATLFLMLVSPLQASEMPLFDAHIHYSHDAVDYLPPEQIAEILKKAGVKRALVSSSDDRGTQLLLKHAPNIVVPALRPYRKRGETGSWMRDSTIIDYVEDLLKRHKYYAIGEFHAFDTDIETPVLQKIIALAKKYDLLLHAHSDAKAVERIFKANPDARVLWAHSGFVRPERVQEMLRKHKNLWADLAFRSDQSSEGKVVPQWREAFEEFPDRFMLGTDTFAPERWHYVGDHASSSRAWLSDLPKELAEKIGFRNAAVMLRLPVAE